MPVYGDTHAQSVSAFSLLPGDVITISSPFDDITVPLFYYEVPMHAPDADDLGSKEHAIYLKFDACIALVIAEAYSSIYMIVSSPSHPMCAGWFDKGSLAGRVLLGLAGR